MIASPDAVAVQPPRDMDEARQTIQDLVDREALLRRELEELRRDFAGQVAA